MPRWLCGVASIREPASLFYRASSVCSLLLPRVPEHYASATALYGASAAEGGLRVAAGCQCRDGTGRPQAARHGTTPRAIGVAAPAPRLKKKKGGRAPSGTHPPGGGCFSLVPPPPCGL